ncbi:MAG: class I SAM-dependent methyltransferase [Solobacterium sp.]|nr:class I SAM-dependent methyltransferase [Solobacterium sp.]
MSARKNAVLISGRMQLLESIWNGEKWFKMKSVYEQVEENIDNLVAKQADWTASATDEELNSAKNGSPILYFYDREVPEDWLKDIKGKSVLCLAGAGGLQAPILASAGAKVTAIDISNKMLDKDREIAEREKLDIEIVKGNMCDLSMFADESFI